MKKNRKKWLWAALAVVLVAAIVVGIVTFTRNSGDPVYVYSVAEVAGMSDYYYDSGYSYGEVTTDRVQTEYISDTQKILEILVEEGQEVKEGDVLFTYDTTLSTIELRQKELSVEQAKLDLETMKKELAVINSYVPISYHEVESTEPTEPAEPAASLADFDLTDKDYLVYSGSGSTSATPKYCWLRSGVMIDETLMAALFAETEENVLFILFQNTEDDANTGEVTEEYGVKLMRLSSTADDGTQTVSYRFSFFDPEANNGGSDTIDDGVDWNSGYTAAEIAAMRTEKQAEIKTQEFNIKVAEAEYSIMQKEADSGEVTAEFDGTVVNLLDAETAQAYSEPLLKVSGGGGFYVEGTVSELRLDTIQIGQTVNILSYDTYESYEGTITAIGQFPDEDYSSGENVSYYPYTVFIDESANLQDGYYVEMTLQAAEGQSSLYILNAFVRSDGAGNYVYVRGEDGRLEKRTVQLGVNLWGSYSQILGGLTEEDYVAFPYGSDVKAGASTQEGTWSDLYYND